MRNLQFSDEDGITIDSKFVSHCVVLVADCCIVFVSINSDWESVQSLGSAKDGKCYQKVKKAAGFKGESYAIVGEIQLCDCKDRQIDRQTDG